MTKTYRIVVADDHAMIRKGIKRIVEEAPHMKVVGEAADGLELLTLLKQITPDIVLLDISMPSLRGIEAIGEVKVLLPEVKVLILTMHKRREYLYQALSAGADGFLLKDDSDVELITALEKIVSGQTYLSPALAESVTDNLFEILRNPTRLVDDPLTQRQRQVLKLVAEGKSNKEIARVLFISEKTVENHRAGIMKRLGLNTLADLIKYAIRQGYTSHHP